MLIVSVIGIIQDINTAVTMDLKNAGNLIYLIGEFKNESTLVPDVPQSSPQVYRTLHQAIQTGIVKSVHDLSEGGLAVAAAEMCIGGCLCIGLHIEIFSLFYQINSFFLV